MNIQKLTDGTLVYPPSGEGKSTAPKFDEYYEPGAPGSYAHLFSPEAQIVRDEALQAKFAKGEGVIQLQPNMPDIVLLSAVKYAIEKSAGKPFLVVPPAA